MKKMNGFNQETMLNVEIKKKLEGNSVPVEFSADIARLTETDFEVALRADRRDLRKLVVMTIDSESCQDMDDAVNLEITETGYTLGVHIADVTAYVLPGSPLDREALSRGTSVYLPGLTIPMLPPVLTNDLCSLVPGKDRNTISILINLDKDANVIDYSITKGLIKSRIKGVYSEINSLFKGTAAASVQRKYAEVTEKLLQMKALSELLRAKRAARGANIQNNSEPKITLEGGRIIVSPEKNEAAEILIEEFMVLANRLVAEFMLANKLPCIFRTQRAKKTRACYMPIVSNHAELALDAYCHFTSPIRRYPDLLVHRVLGYYLGGSAPQEIAALIGEENLQDASDICTKRSRREADIELAIRKYCYARYFSWRRSDQFRGQITSVDRKDRALIRLDDFNLIAIGSAAIKKYMGQWVLFKINIDDRNCLRAHSIVLEAA